MLISKIWFLDVYLLSVAIMALAFGKKREKSTRYSNSDTTECKYDYIIVGGGSSGALLASRLAKETKFEILLLEAGKTPSSQSNIPAYAGQLQHTDMNWGYLWEPQPNFALGLEDYRLPCPSGKALGGTSSINYMIHGRGSKADFDSWAESGNVGWGYEDMLPYFKRYENYTVKVKDGFLHGQNGELSITDVPYRSKASCAFVTAMRQFGYKYVDYNGKREVGVSFVHTTMKNGMRHSSYKAFLEPLINKASNLKVVTEALVAKILITPSKTAYGVIYIKDGKIYVAHAQREVILSAGVFNSPQLLMLSGIGPKKHLRNLGIRIVKDLPVGLRLRDHIGFLGLTYTVNESITLKPEEFINNEALMILKQQGRGPLTSTAGIEALAMIDTNCWARGQNISKPNVEYAFFGMTLNADKGSSLKELYRISDYVYEKFWRKIENKPAFSIVPFLYKSKSTGCIKLRCPDPFEYPLLFGEFYSDAAGDDIKVMIKAIRSIQKVIQMPAFKRYNATLLSPVPGCAQFLIDSDQYWECALRYLPVTFYNPSGTCKMGPDNDPEAVVDPELKVRGIKRLRVVDASIFPDSVSGHINGVCYAIAERISDLIIRGNIKQILVPSTMKNPKKNDQYKTRSSVWREKPRQKMYRKLN